MDLSKAKGKVNGKYVNLFPDYSKKKVSFQNPK